jgi:hypothetical protein
MLISHLLPRRAANGSDEGRLPQNWLESWRSASSVAGRDELGLSGTVFGDTLAVKANSSTPRRSARGSISTTVRSSRWRSAARATKTKCAMKPPGSAITVSRSPEPRRRSRPARTLRVQGRQDVRRLSTRRDSARRQLKCEPALAEAPREAHSAVLLDHWVCTGLSAFVGQTWKVDQPAIGPGPGASPILPERSHVLARGPGAPRSRSPGRGSHYRVVQTFPEPHPSHDGAMIAASRPGPRT